MLRQLVGREVPEPKLVRKTPKGRVLLVVFAVVGLAFWAVLETPFVRALFADKLAEAVRAELGLEISVGSLAFRLPFRLAAEDVRLRHPRHGPLVSARELLVVPSFWGLLEGQLKLKRVIIDEAAIRLQVEDGRVVNFPELPAAPAGRARSGPPRIPLDELVVHHAVVAVDGSPLYSGALRGVNIIARVTDEKRVNLQISAGSGELEHPAGRETLTRLLLVARYAPDRLELEQLRLDGSLGKIVVTHAGIGLPLAGAAYRGTADVALELGRIARLPHGLTLPVIEGKLSLRGSVEGSGERFRARAEVRGDNPSLEDFGFGHLDLKVEANERELILLPGSRGKIIEDGGLVAMEGRLGLGPTLPLDMKVDVKHLVFQKLMKQLGTTDNCVVDWLLRGGFRLKGTIAPLAISGPIWADHLSFRALTGAYHDPRSREVIGTPPGRVAGRVVVRPDALRFENLAAKLPHSDMLVTVHVGFDDKLGVTARSERLDLRDATGLMQKPIAGHGAFTLDVGGTYDHATLTGTLDLEDFMLWNNRIGHVVTRAIMEKEGSAVRFVGTDVRKNASHYVVDDLFLDFSDELALDARARFEHLALSDFYDSIDVADDPTFTRYQGAVKGTATARYTLGFRSDGPDGTLLVDADLDVLEAGAFGLAFEGGRLEGSFGWRDIEAGALGARVDVRELRLAKGRGALVARGAMEYGGALRFTLFGEALRARELRALRERDLTLEGELSVAGTLRGTLTLPELELSLELVGMQLGSRALGDGHGRLYVTHRGDPWVQRALTFDAAAPPASEPCPEARRALAQATWSGTSASERGRLPPEALLLCGPLLRDVARVDLALGFDPDVSVRGRVGLTELPASWLFADVAPRSGLEGRLSGEIALTAGQLAQPDSLVGELSLTRFVVGGARPWLANDGPVRVALTGQGARIERARFVGEGTQLELRGRASLADGLAASVSGALDLGVLPSLAPSVVRARGLLSVDVKLTGVFREPAIFGRAELRDAGVLTRYYSEPLEELNGQFSFSEREILVEQLGARFAGGLVQVSGQAALKGRRLDRYELAIDARSINLEPTAGVQLTLSAETTLRSGAGLRLPTLEGILHVQRARYTRPFSLGIAERLTGFSQARRAEREVYDPQNDRLVLDLRVVDDAPLRVSNNLLNAELAIEDSERPFRIVGTDQRMGVLGTLGFRRGTLRFRSSEFRVEDGSVSFIDEYRIRPLIDLRARTEFRRTADASGARWSIMLHASGEADNLKLETSSVPALAQEDIALLLTAGLTRAEAEQSSGSLGQGAALEALATVAGVDREVKRALPLIDDFAVTSAYSVRTNRTEPQVVVGKRLSDRVRASATAGLTTDSNFKTNVQWRLNDQTSVEAGYDNVQTTTSSQFGNVGVDLRWRLEFD